MDKEYFIETIKTGSKSDIIQCIHSISKSVESLYECLDDLIDYLFQTNDTDIIMQIDLSIFVLSHDFNLLELFQKIFSNKNYSFDIMKRMTNLLHILSKNETLSTIVFFELLLKNQVNYQEETRYILEYSNIDISKVDLNIKDKIICFYRIMGIVTLHIKKVMKLCYDLLGDDEIMVNDNKAIDRFVHFFSWNYIESSSEFVNEVIPTTLSQKQLVNGLNSYVRKYQSEISIGNMIKDFNIKPELQYARHRIELDNSKKMMQQVKSQSIFSQLIPEVKIILGRKIIYIIDNIDDENTVFRESPMLEFKVKCEYPLDYALDPIQYEEEKQLFSLGGNYETNN